MTRAHRPDSAAVLAVDLGKTGCRVAVWTDDTSAPVVREGAGSPGLATPGGIEAAEQAILQTAEATMAASGVQELHACGIGAAGVNAAPDAAVELLERLRTGLPAAHIALTSDAITSHAGALGGAAGVVLAAGTGSVSIAIGPQGQFHQVDGWGPLLGDAGGGAWIGGAGLRAVLRAFDGRGPATALQAAAQQAFGDDLRQLPSAIGQDAAAATRLASFAPAVAAAAAAGDPAAGQILSDAAQALAESIIVAAQHIQEIGEVPVVVTGGLWNIGPALLERIRAALQLSTVPLVIREAEGGSLDGARLVALDHDTAHEPFLYRALGRKAVVTP